MLKFPHTSSPGVAGLVSWTAVFSVFICLVKLLPFTVTVVIVPSGSVACRGTWSCSLCWPLQKWNLLWVVCLFCLPVVIWIDRTALLLTTWLLEMLHKFVNFHYFMNNLDAPQYRGFQSTLLRSHAHWHQCIKWPKNITITCTMHLVPPLAAIVKMSWLSWLRLWDMNLLTMNLFNWCTVCGCLGWGLCQTSLKLAKECA